MARRGSTTERRREVFFEFITIGNSVKVSAIDADSGLEVSITGPRSSSQKELERVALQKLQRRLNQA